MTDTPFFKDYDANWDQVPREEIDWDHIEDMVECSMKDEKKEHIVVFKDKMNGSKIIVNTKQGIVVEGCYNELTKDNLKERMPTNWEFFLDSPDVEIKKIKAWKPWKKLQYNPNHRAFLRFDHKMGIDQPGLSEYSPSTKYYKITLAIKGMFGHSHLFEIWAAENYSRNKNEFHKKLSAPKIQELFNQTDKSMYAIQSNISDRVILLKKHTNEESGDYHWIVQNNIW